MNTLVSIIIPVYNSHLYIEECLRSARNQSYTNTEIIVIDDGSDYRTKDKLKELKRFIDIHIIQENLGPSAARNNGIRKAKGSYLLILDSDDYFKPTFLEKALSILEKNENVKFVSCYLHRFEKEFISPEIQMNGGTVKDFLFRNAALGNGLFRKCDIDSIGGYDENMRDGYVDWELIIRLLKNGGIAEIIPEALFMYRSSLQIVTNRAKLKRPEILKYIFKKHSDLYQDNFNSLIDFYTREQNQLLSIYAKVLSSKDFRLGRNLLYPIRRLKGIIKA